MRDQLVCGDTPSLQDSVGLAWMLQHCYICQSRERREERSLTDVEEGEGEPDAGQVDWRE